MKQRVPNFEEFLNEDYSIKNKKAIEPADGDYEIKIVARNPEGTLVKLLDHIAASGNTGHSFSILVDPDLPKADGGQVLFGWDGDGPDMIKSISSKQVSVNESEINEKGMMTIIKLSKKDLEELVQNGEIKRGGSNPLKIYVKD